MSGFQRWCESSSGKPWKILRTTITGTLISNQSCSVIFQCCDIFYLWLLHKTPHSKISAATRTVNQGSPHPTSMFCGKFFDIYLTLTLQFTNSFIMNPGAWHPTPRARWMHPNRPIPRSWRDWTTASFCCMQFGTKTPKSNLSRKHEFIVRNLAVAVAWWGSGWGHAHMRSANFCDIQYLLWIISPYYYIIS